MIASDVSKLKKKVTSFFFNQSAVTDHALQVQVGNMTATMIYCGMSNVNQYQAGPTSLTYSLKIIPELKYSLD